MVGIIYESSAIHFLIFTILIGGAAAFQTGRAVAQTWQPIWYILPYAVLLAATVRFLHYAVLHQTLLSLHYFIIDFCALAIAGCLGWRIKRGNQMATQYSWLYKRLNALVWHKKS
jgi:hypothetical protein